MTWFLLPRPGDMLPCNRCNAVSCIAPLSVLITWTAAWAGLLAVIIPFILFTSTPEWAVLPIALLVGASTHVVAVYLWGRPKLRKKGASLGLPRTQISGSELAGELKTLTRNGDFCVLFNRSDNSYLTISHRDDGYYMELSLSLGEHLDLRGPFEQSAKNERVRLIEGDKNGVHYIEGAIGEDAETAAKHGWAIFSGTFGLRKDEKVSYQRS